MNRRTFFRVIAAGAIAPKITPTATIIRPCRLAPIYQYAALDVDITAAILRRHRQVILDAFLAPTTAQGNRIYEEWTNQWIHDDGVMEYYKDRVHLG